MSAPFKKRSSESVARNELPQVIHRGVGARETGLKQIMDSLPTGLFITDEQGRINYFNRAAERITGLSASDAFDMRCKDIFRCPLQRDNCPFGESVEEDRGFDNRDLFVNKPNQRIVPVACSVSPLKDSEGRQLGYTGVFQDISVQKDLEMSLRESERKLSTLISNLPGMSYRCLNDKNWTMEFISEGCHDLTGYRPSDLIGNRILSYNEVIHQMDRDSVWEDIQKALAEKKPFQLEYRIRTRDGAEKWVWEQGRGVFDTNGELLALEGLISEITEHKRLEEDLKASERKYRRLFEGSKDMIFITSRDGTIKEVNQACVDLLKYSSKKELQGLSSAEGIYDNPRHWQVFQKQIDLHGFVKDFEARFRKKDGTRIHCLLSGNAVRGPNGHIVGYEGIAKDITARVDASKNLLQRHQELQLVHSVALAINQSRDLDEVLMAALKNVLAVLNLSAGGIFLIDHDMPAFELRVQQGLPINEERRADRILLSDQLLMQSLLTKHISITPKAMFPSFKAILRDGDQNGPIELTCFLITVREKASGFIALDVPPGRDLRDGQDSHLLGALGNFLGGAIENARLLETIHKHREELKRLTARLFHSQEEERKRIAQELHDEAGQALTGINFVLETLKRGLPSASDHLQGLLSDVKIQINRTYEDMRNLSHRLHPSLLSDLGLEPALDSYLRSISRHSDLKIDFRMVGFEKRILPEIETVLYRLAQEALTNVLRHSHAKAFRLSIIKSYPDIIFVAEDDGLGFDYGRLEKNRQALGLLGMRERAAMLGGSFSIRTALGKGTRIHIRIPVSRGPHD